MAGRRPPSLARGYLLHQSGEEGDDVAVGFPQICGELFRDRPGNYEPGLRVLVSKFYEVAAAYYQALAVGFREHRGGAPVVVDKRDFADVDPAFIGVQGGDHILLVLQGVLEYLDTPLYNNE